ncbi:hypothetical protein H4R24_002107 [Coemansia sp. RSA 988]|nr:hypothetical protein H4R24_002107 [Coemansia sp. RSA 988]
MTSGQNNSYNPGTYTADLTGAFSLAAGTSAMDTSGNSRTTAGSGNPQHMVPITPNISSDSFLATQAVGLGNFYSGPGANVPSIGISSSDASSIAGALLNFGGIPLACAGEAVSVSNESNNVLTGQSGDPLYAQGYSGLNEQLQGMLVMPMHGSTPPVSVSSPDYLNGCTGASDLSTMVGVQPTQASGLSYTQALQMRAPLPQATQNAANSSTGTAAAATGMGNALVYSTPIMGSTQLPAEPLFRHIAYTNASAAFVPNMDGSAGNGMQMYAYPQHNTARSGIPSLVHTPQPEHSLDVRDMLALNTHATPSLVGSLADSIGDTQIAIQQQQQQNSLPGFLAPNFAASPDHLAHLRPQRSLSLSEPARARSSSPCLNRLATMPNLTGHPYFPRHTLASRGTAADVHGNNAHFRRIRSHARTGSDNVVESTSRLSIEQSSHMPRGWRLGCGASGSSAASRTSTSLGTVHMYPTVAGHSDESIPSSDDARSLNNGEFDTGSEVQRTPSGRIPLTREQREIFFRWLYENAHDPKPKGIERDRLRRIGNMTRDRFKTWFANARRRYFKITYDDGVQRYAVNERFRVACHRAKINID